mmetsp:Transcript_45720/g.115555  ORF Transcript_45720/g.115555 Transcript_45720/m.115555 type:complete len:232 (+) Transcript_45720:121-816(+)
MRRKPATRASPWWYSPSKSSAACCSTGSSTDLAKSPWKVRLVSALMMRLSSSGVSLGSWFSKVRMPPSSSSCASRSGLASGSAASSAASVASMRAEQACRLALSPLSKPASRSRMGVMDSCSHTVSLLPSTKSGEVAAACGAVAGEAAAGADCCTEPTCASVSSLSFLAYSATEDAAANACASSPVTTSVARASLSSLPEKKPMPRMLTTALRTVVARASAGSDNGILAFK